jgi:hypothetical protein
MSSPAVWLTLRVNGKKHVLPALDPRTTLLDALREHVKLTGTKKGCDLGQCGACTVLADGRRITACLALVALYEGSEITTIEGLTAGDGADLDPLQQAFLAHDASIAAWEGGVLTLWDKTQWVGNVRDELAAVFGIPPEHVRVVSPFVGGRSAPRSGPGPTSRSPRWPRATWAGP